MNAKKAAAKVKAGPVAPAPACHAQVDDSEEDPTKEKVVVSTSEKESEGTGCGCYPNPKIDLTVKEVPQCIKPKAPCAGKVTAVTT